MKLLQFKECHFKNMESMRRMCAVYNIEYELTTDMNRLSKIDYTILWVPMGWIDPPENVYVLYGPHFFVFPDNTLIGPLDTTIANRCVYTSLCNWNLDICKEFSDSYRIPIKPLYFGISDEIPDYSNTPKDIDCVVYIKDRSFTDVSEVLSSLTMLDIIYEVFHYGSYKNDEYLNSLSRSKFCIWIGRHESQGFCFQETLATNTPILLWDVNSMFEEINKNGVPEYARLLGQKKLLATAAVLWSDDCGLKIDKGDISEKIEMMMERYKEFKPRQFILENASDKLCMGRILDQFGLKV